MYDIKKYIILLIVALTLSSCLSEVLKPNDLKNCVVMTKSEPQRIKFESYPMCMIQYVNLNDSTYNTCYVHEFFAKDWNVGDTIK